MVAVIEIVVLSIVGLLPTASVGVPWMDGFAPRTSVREPTWAVELMRGYW